MEQDRSLSATFEAVKFVNEKSPAVREYDKIIEEGRQRRSAELARRLSAPTPNK